MPKYLIECEFSGEDGLGDDELKTTIQNAFTNPGESDSALQLLEGYVSDNKIYCVCFATDEDGVHKHIDSNKVSVSAIARICVSTDAGISERPDATKEDRDDEQPFPTEPSGDVVEPRSDTEIEPKKKVKARKKLGPVGNLIGMVLFGVVGLVLGFVVLFFIPDDHYPTYGKAGRIIKMFPESVQTWLPRFKDAPIGIEKSGGSWDIGSSRDDGGKEDPPASSSGTDAKEKTNRPSSSTTKARPQKLPTEAKGYRIFKDNTGKHETDAYLETVEGPNVYLKKRDGETKEVPMDRLSDEDQRWIHSEMERRKALNN
ncbi:MAG: SHD1 domain-containing protein [Pirellulales bacterium]|nr:SHD1 domain-containing protein [Pirellulales bacterium]